MLLASPQYPTTERDDGMFYQSDRGPQCASTRAEQLAGAGAEPWREQGRQLENPCNGPATVQHWMRSLGHEVGSLTRRRTRSRNWRHEPACYRRV